MDELPWQASSRQELAAALRKLNLLLDAGKTEEAKEQARAAIPLALMALKITEVSGLYRKLKEIAGS